MITTSSPITINNIVRWEPCGAYCDVDGKPDRDLIRAALGGNWFVTPLEACFLNIPPLDRIWLLDRPRVLDPSVKRAVIWHVICSQFPSPMAALSEWYALPIDEAFDRWCPAVAALPEVKVEPGSQSRLGACVDAIHFACHRPGLIACWNHFPDPDGTVAYQIIRLVKRELREQEELRYGCGRAAT